MSKQSPDWDWIFHYDLSRKLDPANLSSSPEITFVIDSENNVTGFDLRVSTVGDNGDSAPEDRCNNTARMVAQMISATSLTRIATHVTGYEGMPRAKGKLGHTTKRVTLIYNIEGAPVKTGRLDLTDTKTQNLMTSANKSNNLEQLSKAISHLYDNRYDDSIIEASKIIEGNPKSVTGYRKYRCIRNILMHNKLEPRVIEDFKKYFNPNGFDFKGYDPKNNTIIIDLDSTKTQKSLEQVAKDLISEVNTFLNS